MGDETKDGDRDSVGPLTGSVRLARFLAACGIGSRRRCEEIIGEGRVVVNGETVSTPAVNVDVQGDDICLDGRRIRPCRTVYYLLNKPCGYTCTVKDPHASRVVYELLPTDERLFTVGRLDRESEGLLIITNDGDFSQRLAHPRYQVAKVYAVTVDKRVGDAELQGMIKGIHNAGEFLHAEKAWRTTNQREDELTMQIREGRKREVRRLCEHFGYRVQRLVRIQYGGIHLEGLASGSWRELSKDEIESLLAVAR